MPEVVRLATRILPITSSAPLVEQDGTPSQEASGWINNITRQATITGIGSPEGVVEADITAEYMDLSGSTGTLIYRKVLDNIAGDRKLGWILV